MTTRQTDIMPRADAQRFLAACLEVLRGGDVHGDDPAFGPMIEWLWDQANNGIGQVFATEPVKLRVLRQQPFATEIVRRTGGSHPSGDDYLAMRERLIAVIEEALDAAPGGDKPASSGISMGSFLAERSKQA
jgi:hypothetical protein